MVSLEESIEKERSVVVHSVNRGEFWKPCPGTSRGYLCCGYQILTPMTGCGMYCRYCILQSYLESQSQIVYDNLDDLANEVRLKMTAHNGVVRFGTGEFGDSLFQEPRLGLSRKIAEVLAPYPNALIEFKTKSNHIDTLDSIVNRNRIVIGFSVNTPRMIDLHERGTAALKERFAAARRCEEMGFHVSFHFDPMFFYDGSEEEYRAVVRLLFESQKSRSNIAWCSLGGFRSMSSLKALLRKRNAHAHLPLFSGEMIAGEDGKYRYVRPIRTALYRAIDDEFRKQDPDTVVYLCMESPEVWRDAGMIGRLSDGLVGYLDRRAEQILGFN